MVTIKSPARVAINKLYPASVYSRPAIAPLMVGVGGQTGKAQSQLADMYKYSLQQMAVSPFSVNSEEYMKRIREEYGYADNGMYDTMGTVGSVVGAGMGAFIGAGGWKGFHTDNFKLFNPKTWFDSASYQNPFQNPFVDGAPVGSKRQQTSAAFRVDTDLQSFIRKNKDTVEKYNKSLTGYQTSKRKLDRFVKHNKLENLDTKYNKLDGLYKKGLTADSVEVKKLQKEIDDIVTKIGKDDVIEQYKSFRKNYDGNLVDFNDSKKVLRETAEGVIKNTESSEQLVKGASKILNNTDEALTLTGKALSKIGSTAMGIVGTGLDVVSLGFNVTGAVQAFQDGVVLDGALYTLGAVGDAVSIAGDVIAFIPGVGTVAGTVLNWVGALVSMGAGALIGSRVGETVGHSLSPEGAKAQALFAKNLYGSIINRPLTTIASVVTFAGVPLGIQSLSSIAPTNTFKKILSSSSTWLTTNAIGVNVRSAATMMIAQGVNALTTKVEDTWKAPDSADEVNFVSAFSVVGDLNDNLFGATARKATLLGLAKGDPHAQTEALARAWGYSNEDIYYNPGFDDIREAAGIDLGNLGNSFLSTVGEILIDPQNYTEIAEKTKFKTELESKVSQLERELILNEAKFLSGEDIDPVLKRILFNQTDDGYVIKTLVYNKTSDSYMTIDAYNKKLDSIIDTEELTKFKESHETIEVVKNDTGIHKVIYDEQKGTVSVDQEKLTNRSLQMAYNHATYDTSKLMHTNRKILKRKLQNYLRGYMMNGLEGMSDAHRSELDYATGSKYVALTLSDKKFLTDLVELFGKLDSKSPRISISNIEALENDSKLKNKFKHNSESLFAYYGIDNKDVTELLRRLKQEFNIHISDEQTYKMYQSNNVFRNQMDLISMTMGDINKIVNPIAALIEQFGSKIVDKLLYNSTKINKEHKQKLIQKFVEDLPNAITIEDIKTRKKELDDANLSTKKLKEQMLEKIQDEIESSEEFVMYKDELIEELNETKNIIEDQKEKIKEYQQLQRESRMSSTWEYTHKKTGQTITVTEETIKKYTEELKELQSKPTLNKEEKARAKELEDILKMYEWNTGCRKVIANIYSQSKNALILFDSLSLSMNEKLIDILKTIHTFNTIQFKYVSKANKTKDKQLYTKVLNELPLIAKELLTLGLKMEIKDPEGNTIKVIDDNGNVVKKADGTDLLVSDIFDLHQNKPLKITLRRHMTLSEIVALRINEMLVQQYETSSTKDVMNSLRIKELTLLKELLLGIDFDDWKKISSVDEKNKILETAIKGLCNDKLGNTARLRMILLTPNQKDSVLKSIREEIDTYAFLSKNGNTIDIEKSLVDVDESFLRSIVFEHVLKNKTHKAMFEEIANAIEIFYNYTEEIIDAADYSTLGLIQHALDARDEFMSAMKHTAMYDFFVDFMRTRKYKKGTELFFASSETSLHTKIYDGAIANVKKHKSAEETSSLQQLVADSEDTKINEEVFELMQDYADSTEYYKHHIVIREGEEVLSETELEYNLRVIEDIEDIKEHYDNLEQYKKDVLAKLSMLTESQVASIKKASSRAQIDSILNDASETHMNAIHRVEDYESYTEHVEQTKEDLNKIRTQILEKDPYIEDNHSNINLYGLKKLKDPNKSNLEFILELFTKYNVDLFDDVLEVSVTQSMFRKSNSDKNSAFITLLKNKGYNIASLKGYERMREKFAKALVKMLESDSILYIKISGKKHTLANTKPTYLINLVTDAYLEGKHINIGYNRMFTTAKGRKYSITERIYRKVLRKYINVTLMNDIQDGTFTNTLGILREDVDNLSVKEIMQFLKTNYKQTNNLGVYLNNVLTRAEQAARKSLVNSRDLFLVGSLDNNLKELYEFEWKTVSNVVGFSQVMSDDIPKKLLSNDEYFKDFLNDILAISNETECKTAMGKILNYLKGHIVELPESTKKFKTDNFKAIDFRDGEYYFITINDIEFTIFDLLYTYNINIYKFDKLISHLTKNFSIDKQEKFIMDARFKFKKEAEKYNEIIGNKINYTTEEEFINLTLVKEGLDYTDRSNPDVKKRRDELKEIYIKLMDSPEIQELYESLSMKKKTDKYNIYYDERIRKINLDAWELYNVKKTNFMFNNTSIEQKDYDFDEYFVLYLINQLHTTKDDTLKDNIVQVLEDIVFYDVKQAMSYVSDNSILKLKQAIENYKNYKNDNLNNANVNQVWLDEQIKSMETAVKYYTKLNNLFKKSIKEDTFKSHLINLIKSNSIDAESIISIYSNRNKISDINRFAPIIYTKDNKEHAAFILKNATHAREQYTDTETGDVYVSALGILNVPILSRFHTYISNKKQISKLFKKDTFEIDKDTKINYYVASEEGYELIIVGEDADLTYANAIKVDRGSDVKKVYVITENDFKTIRNAYTSKDPNVKLISVDMNELSNTQELEKVQIEHRINIKGSKVLVPNYLKDLQTIHKYLKNDADYKKFIEFVELYNTYNVAPGGYATGATLTSSTIFKSLTKDIKTTLAFFEFIEFFRGDNGEINVDINRFADFFSDKYVKSTDTDIEVFTHNQIKDLGTFIKNGVMISYEEALTAALRYLNDKYKDSDVQFDAKNVLNVNMRKHIQRMSSLVKQFENTLRKNLVGKPEQLKNLYNRFKNEYITEYKVAHVQYMQDLSNSIYDEIMSISSGSFLDNCAVYWQRKNKTTTYTLRRKKEKYNATKTHAEQSHINYDNVEKLVDIADKLREDISKWDTLIKDICSTETIERLSVLFIGKSKEEIREYLLNNIIAPFLKNISIDINKAPKFIRDINDTVFISNIKQENLLKKKFKSTKEYEIIENHIANGSYLEPILYNNKEYSTFEFIKLMLKDEWNKITHRLKTDEKLSNIYTIIKILERTEKLWELYKYDTPKAQFLAQQNIWLQQNTRLQGLTVEQIYDTILYALSSLYTTAYLKVADVYKPKKKMSVDKYDYYLYDYIDDDFYQTHSYVFNEFKYTTKKDQVENLNPPKIIDHALQESGVDSKNSAEFLEAAELLLIEIKNNLENNISKENEDTTNDVVLKFLEDNEIKNLQDLKKYIVQTHKHTLTDIIKKYVDINTVSIDSINKLIDTVLDKYLNIFNPKYNKPTQTFNPEIESIFGTSYRSDVDSYMLDNEIFEIFNTYSQHIYFIENIYTKKVKNVESFKNTKEVIEHVNTDTLMHHEGFFRYLKEHFDANDLFTIFFTNNYKNNYRSKDTLYSFYTEMENMELNKDNIHKVFGIVVYINHLKEQYIHELKKKNWKSAIYSLEVRESLHNLDLIAKLEQVLTSTKGVRISIPRELSKPFYKYNKVLSLMEVYNDKLRHTVDDSIKSPTLNTFTSKVTVVRENNINVIAKRIQNQNTSVLFKIQDPTLGIIAANKIRQEIMAGHLDMIAEASASSLDTMPVINDTYDRLRHLFTDILQKSKDVKDTEFVKIYQITTALKIILKDADLAAFYLHQFENVWFKDIDASTEIQKVHEYFHKKNTSLIEITEDQIKAIIGYIYYNKHSRVNASERVKEIDTFTKERREKLFNYQYNDVQGYAESVMNILYSKSSDEEKALQITEMLYGKSKISEEQKKEITELIKYRNEHTSTKLTENKFTWDTYKIATMDIEKTGSATGDGIGGVYEKAMALINASDLVKNKYNIYLEQMNTYHNYIKQTKSQKIAKVVDGKKIEYVDINIGLKTETIGDVEKYTLYIDPEDELGKIPTYISDIEKYENETLNVKIAEIDYYKRERRTYIDAANEEMILQFVCSHPEAVQHYKQTVEERYNKLINELEIEFGKFRNEINDKYPKLMPILQRCDGIGNYFDTEVYEVLSLYRKDLTHNGRIKNEVLKEISEFLQIDLKTCKKYIEEFRTNIKLVEDVKKEIATYQKDKAKYNVQHSVKYLNTKTRVQYIEYIKHKINLENKKQKILDAVSLLEKVTAQQKDKTSLSTYSNIGIEELSTMLSAASNHELSIKESENVRKELYDIAVHTFKQLVYEVRNHKLVLLKDIYNNFEEFINKQMMNKGDITLSKLMLSKFRRESYKDIANIRIELQKILNDLKTKSWIPQNKLKTFKFIYNTQDEVIEAYQTIKGIVDKNLKKLKEQAPKIEESLESLKDVDLSNITVVTRKNLDKIVSEQSKNIFNGRKLNIQVALPKDQLKYIYTELYKRLNNEIEHATKKISDLHNLRMTFESESKINGSTYNKLSAIALDDAEYIEQVTQVLSSKLGDEYLLTEDTKEIIAKELEENITLRLTDKEIDELNKKRKLYVDALEHNKKVISSLESIDSSMKAERTAYEELQKYLTSIIALIEEYNKIDNVYKANRKNTSNSALYRKFAKLGDDVDIVEHVCNRAVNDGIITKEMLDNALENSVEQRTLHNPVIDCLLTTYHYLYQKGAIDNNGRFNPDNLKDDKFIVFDMETVVDYTGKHTPYELTLIIYDKNKGTKIITECYNSHVFQSDIDNPDEYLKMFIEQQKDMHKELSHNEVIELTKRIIKRVKLSKNSFSKTLAILRTLEFSDCPIVAHNGERFDFVVFDDFIKKYSTRILKNKVFDILYSDAETVIRRFGGVDESVLLEDISDETIKNVIKQYQKNPPNTENEIKAFEKLIMELYETRISNFLAKQFAEASESAEISYSNEQYKKLFTDPNSKLNKIKEKIYDYLYSDDNIPKEEVINVLKELLNVDEVKINKLLDTIKSEVKSMLDNDETISYTAKNEKQIIKDIIEKIGIPKSEWKRYSMKERIESFDTQLKTLLGMLKHIEDPTFKRDFTKGIEKVKTQIDSTKKDAEIISKAIQTLKTSIQDYESENTKLYKGLNDVLNKLKTINLNSSRQMRSAVNNYLLEQSNKKALSSIDIDAINVNINLANTQIQEHLNILTHLIECIRTNTDINVDKIISPYIYNLNNIKDSESVIKVLEERKTFLSNSIKTISDDTLSKDKFEKVFNSTIDLHKSNIDEQINNALNLIEFLIKNNPDINKELLNIEALLKLDFDLKTYEQVYDSIKKLLNTDKGKALKNNDETFRKFMVIFDTKNILKRSLDVVKYKDYSTLLNEDIEDTLIKRANVLITAMEDEIKRIENTLDILNILKNKTTTKFVYTDINRYLQNMLEVIYSKDYASNVIREATEAAYFRKDGASIIPKNINKGSEEYEKLIASFIKAASTSTHNEELYRQTGRYKEWNEARMGNDQKAITLKSYNGKDDGYYFYKYDEYGLTIYVNTYEHNVLQKAFIPLVDDGEGNTKLNTKDITYTFTYVYTEKSKVLQKPDMNVKTYTDPNLDEIFNPTNTEAIIRVRSEDLYFENKVDSNKIAIRNLVNIVQDLTKQKDILKYLQDEKQAIDQHNVPTYALTTINLSEDVRRKYSHWMAIINNVQKEHKQKTNMQDLYMSLYKQVMGDLNALKYGQYIIRFPEEFDYNNTIIKVEDHGVTSLDIETLKGTEAKMGWNIAIKDEYSIDPLFPYNTNAVRSILTSQVLYALFTPIGINNDMFFRQDIDTESKRLEDYIYDITDTDDAKKFETYLENKIIKLQYDELSKEALEHFKRTQRAIEEARYNLFVKTYKDTQGQEHRRTLYTMRIGTKDLLTKYNKDILHPIGINATVAFASDARAFEDDFLIDAEFARVAGWTEGNKTWTKYGFKGAVKIIDGLRKLYGADIVGSAKSVKERGSYGTYMEMALNKILDYRLYHNDPDKLKEWAANNRNAKALLDMFKNIDKVIPMYDDWTQVKGDHFLYIVGDTLCYKDDLDDDDLTQFLIKNNVVLNKDYTDIITENIVDDVEKTYIITDPKTGLDIQKRYTKDNANVYRGTMYVIADPEHTAAHMQTMAELQLSEDAEFTYILRDSKGSVGTGGMFSFTVEESFAQKCGFEWIKGLIEDADTNTEVLTHNTIDIFLQGFKLFEHNNNIVYTSSQHTNEFINIEKTLDNILNEYKLPNSYKNVILNILVTLQSDYPAKSISLNTPNLEVLDNKLKQLASKNLQGNKNLLVRNNYRRFLAVRSQLLANTYLQTGEIKMPINSYKHLLEGMSDTERWIKDTDITIDKINLELMNYIKQITSDEPKYLQIDLDANNNIINRKTGQPFPTEDMIELKKQLDYIGVHKYIKYEGIEYLDINEIETPVYIKNISLEPNKSFVQTTAYVLAIRTPVQDYNATPVLKITGLVNHTAMECHAALYGNIGGDNDGDTAAFLPVRYTEVTDGVLTNLKATSTGLLLRKNDTKELRQHHEGNYDRGYLDNLRSDLNYNIPNYIAEKLQEKYTDVNQCLTDLEHIFRNQVKLIINNKGKWILVNNNPNESEDYIPPYIEMRLLKSLNAPIVINEIDATSHYYTSDMTRAYIGKNAAPKSTIELTYNGKEFSTSKVKAYNVRTKDTQYTNLELINNAGNIGKDKIKGLLESITNGNIKISNEKINNGLYTEEMFWISVHIWFTNNGQELSQENFYDDANAIKEYAKEHREEIQLLKKLEYYLRNDGKDIVKGFKLNTRTYAGYSTLTRGHVSKAGISTTGTMRKNIYLSTELSTYSNMNKDRSGSIWNKAYGVNYNRFTMYDLMSAVFNKTNVDKLIDNNLYDIEDIRKLQSNLNELSKLINWNYFKKLNPTLSLDNIKSLYRNSYDLYSIANTMLDRIIEYKIAQTIIKPLFNFAKVVYDSTNADTSWKNLYTILKLDELLPEMEQVKNYIEINNLQNSTEKVSEPVQEFVLSYYFSRFRNDLIKENKKVIAYNKHAKKFKHDTTTLEKVYLNNMLNQVMLTRSTSKKLNQMIQMPISESKHGSILKDGTDTYKWFLHRADTITSSLVSNRFMVGNNYKHKRWVSLGGDYNYIDNHNIKYSESQDVKNIRTSNAQESNQYQNPETHTQETFNKAVENILKIDVCGGFISSANFDNFLNSFENFTNILHNSAENNNGKFDPVVFFNEATDEQIKKVINAVRTFERYNIPFYKLVIGTIRIQEKYNQFNNTTINPVYYSQEIIRYYLSDKYKMQMDYANALSENPNFVYFFNYIIDADNPISALDTQVSADIINKKLENSQIRKGNKFISNLDILEQLAETKLPKKTESQKVYNNALEYLLREYKLSEVVDKTNLENLIKENIKSIQQAEIIKNRNLQILDMAKNSTTLESTISKLIKKTIGPSSYYDSTTKMSIIKNSLIHNQQFIKDLENQINKKEKDLKKLDIQLDELNVYLKTIEEEDPNNLNSTLKEMLESEIKEIETKKKKEYMKIIQHVIANNSDLINYMISDDNSDFDNIKPLTNQDVRNFESQLIMNLDNYQHPFHILVSMFPLYTKNKKGIVTEDVDWKAMYNYLKQNHRFMRITQVIPAEDTEGLAKRFLDFVKVVDENEYEYDGKKVTWDELPKEYRKKYLEQHNQAIHFETFEDLTAQANKVFRLGTSSKLYRGADININVAGFISPTLKQLEINSPDDLKNIWKHITDNEDTKRYPIGFTYLNEIISATEDAYKPFKITGFGSKVISGLLTTQKFLMRYSQGFLLRNYIDTIVQIGTDMYNQEGLRPFVYDTKQLYKYIKYGEDVYSVYHLISEERLVTLIDIMNTYKGIKELKDPNKQLEASKHLIYYLERYINQASNMDNPNDRITYRLEVAKNLLKEYNDKGNKLLFDKTSVVTKVYNFLMNIRFAEYYYFYDTKIVNGKSILGLRIDADASEQRKESKKIQRIISKQDDLFEKLLIDISAFMQTNAQVDMFKEKQYKELFEITKKNKALMIDVTTDERIEIIEKEIYEQRKELSKTLDVLQTLSGHKLYSYLTERTENMARILGFILNRDLYNKSFEDSVQLSLKSWFNYGQRTPLEMQLMYDIPYISFPIRSIRNWTSRLLNPRYAVLIDDIIDGTYGQYADEDGQYSEYEQFMIQNGWLPITDTWGIKLGSSVFDTMGLLYKPAEQIEQRRSPILRGLSKLIETGDLAQATKQLSTVGILDRFAQHATLGAYNSKKQTVTKPTLGRASSMFFEYNNYEQYTPKKYSYLYDNNGRAKYYENIYRDWFTKYGRMRKPTVDPVQLVKNVQWKQFLKRMQNKYRR